MTKGQIALATAALVAAVFALVPGLANFVGLFLYVGIFQTFFPSTISWGDQNGYLKCAGAIANPAKWPIAPNAACLAMGMCANEAPLTDGQRQTLYEQIRKTPGCQEP